MANKAYLFILSLIFILTVTVISGVGGYYLAVNRVKTANNIGPTVIPTVTPAKAPLQAIPLMGKTSAISYDSFKFLYSLGQSNLIKQAIVSLSVSGNLKRYDPSHNEIVLNDPKGDNVLNLAFSPQELKIASVSAHATPSGEMVPYKLEYLKPWDWVSIWMVLDLLTNEAHSLDIKITPNY